MQSTNQPAKFLVPFAQNDSARVEIPATTTDPTRFSQEKGSPPLTGMPPEAGGVPPQLEDFNGALNQIARGVWWALGGGRFAYDSAWASDMLIGGYARGAVLPAALGTGVVGMGEWYNNAEANTVDPDVTGTGWVPGYHYGATALASQTGGTVTLTPAQAAKRVITVAGTLTSNLVLVVPDWVYDWTVYNNTGGAFTVTVKNAATPGVVIPQNGAPTPVRGDGTQVSLSAENIAPATSATQALQLGQAVGRLLNVQTFNASGTYTPTVGTTKVKVIVVGGGGGGGACATTGAGQTSVAASGGGGGFAISLINVPAAGTAVTVGAAGARGEGAVTSGTAGGASSFAGVSASGGAGGAAGSAVTAPNVTGGADGGLGTGGNILNGRGTSGAPGLHMSSASVVAGVSGSSLFGGAVSNAAVGGAGADGQAGGAPGAAGSGGVAAQSQVGRRGGNGLAGIVIIEEYA